VFAASVRNSMRLDDIIGRLGGEEFAAIVDATSENTAKIAERVRAGFERDGAVIAGQPVAATVSIGTATAPANVGAIEKLLARADAALYLAKTEGRNRFKVAGPWAESTASEANKPLTPAVRAEPAPLSATSEAA